MIVTKRFDQRLLLKHCILKNLRLELKGLPKTEPVVVARFKYVAK